MEYLTIDRLVFEDEVSGNLLASGTVFLERKFIRANALVIIGCFELETSLI